MATPTSGAYKRKSEDEAAVSRKRFKPSFEKTISVLVGSRQRQFIVHEDLLCDRSTFFKAACSKKWQKNQEKIVRLLDEDHEIFSLYLERVYDPNGSVASTMRQLIMRDMDCDDFAGFSGCVIGLAVGLWTLGDYLGDSAVVYEAMDVLLHESQFMDLPVTPCTAKYIMDSTRSGCGLQRWLAKSYAFTLKIGKHEDCVEELPAELVRNILKCRLRGQEQTLEAPPKPEDRCRYHDHPKDAKDCNGAHNIALEALVFSYF